MSTQSALLKVMSDAARKAATQASLWAFLALLLGAFTASYTATIGGKHRDAV